MQKVKIHHIKGFFKYDLVFSCLQLHKSIDKNVSILNSNHGACLGLKSSKYSQKVHCKNTNTRCFLNSS